jgi:N-acetylglucosaminyldiphosphoundecaprenol N-acetyl-beta-D-mannosaminyltransferase
MSSRRIEIVGTKVSVVTLPDVLRTFESWITDRSGRYVVCRDVHGVIRARNDKSLQATQERADIVTPDGVPLVWTAKLLGCRDIARVCGPDLLLASVERGIKLGWRHYFYGGTPETVERLEQRLKSKFPDMNVVGRYSPPFRPTTPEEDEQACERIRACGADFVWIGLGSPKQEFWMADNTHRCGGAVLVGVGAAFDFHAGTVARAPKWMRESGLEWAHRLIKEPRRLWRRYFATAPQFVLYASTQVVLAKFAELSGIRGSDEPLKSTDGQRELALTLVQRDPPESVGR